MTKLFNTIGNYLNDEKNKNIQKIYQLFKPKTITKLSKTNYLNNNNSKNI